VVDISAHSTHSDSAFKISLSRMAMNPRLRIFRRLRPAPCVEDGENYIIGQGLVLKFSHSAF
jgi:hypothetical protein